MAGAESPVDDRYEPPVCGRCTGMGYESGLNADPVCPDCSGTGVDIEALVALVILYRKALLMCAEIAGVDGESIEAARSGAMVEPTLENFAIRAVDDLRKDYDNG